jgi:hypothetical protein
MEVLLTTMMIADKSEAEARWARENRPSEWEGKV